jgi:hypothetical protein
MTGGFATSTGSEARQEIDLLGVELFGGQEAGIA